MLTRKQISEALEDRITFVVHQKTGISRPTLGKLRTGDGNVIRAIQEQISAYLLNGPSDGSN